MSEAEPRAMQNQPEYPWSGEFRDLRQAGQQSPESEERLERIKRARDTIIMDGRARNQVMLPDLQIVDVYTGLTDEEIREQTTDSVARGEKPAAYREVLNDMGALGLGRKVFDYFESTPMSGESVPDDMKPKLVYGQRRSRITRIVR